MQSSAEHLRGRGLRVTSQRQAVLGALAEMPHATAAELSARLAAEGVLPTSPMSNPMSNPMSKQGLYNVLEDLTRVGLVRCIEPARSPARYELRVGDNHHHVVCRSCGRMEDIDCAVGEAPCLEPAQAAGFVVDEAEVTWWGRCESCLREPPAEPARSRHSTGVSSAMSPKNDDELRRSDD